MVQNSFDDRDYHGQFMLMETALFNSLINCGIKNQIMDKMKLSSGYTI